MLLRSCERMYLRALREISQDLHPPHSPGAGPEQDYLSRLYAPYWHHIPQYNFQLRHVLLALESSLCYWNELKDDADFPERVTLSLDGVSTVHFRGTLVLWHRETESPETDKDFSRRVLRECHQEAYARWVERNGAMEKYRYFGINIFGKQVL